MDFSKILNIAANNKEKQVVVKRYSTEVSAPKKLSRGNVQSDAIKAFLRRKEQEEMRKAREAIKKKEELLSLRAAAKHNRRATAMAKRTKDNNFAAKFEEKELPPDVQKSILRNEKQANNSRQVVDEFEDRVSSKNSLNYKSCERNKPLSISEKERIKVRTHDSSVNKSILPSVKHERINHDKIEDSNVPKKINPLPSKVKSKPPPPQEKLDFFTLLKIAKQKQHEPINIPKKKVEAPERPMTQEEKDRLLEESNHKAGKPNVVKKRTDVSSKNEKLEKNKPKVSPGFSKQNSNPLLQERTKNSVSQPLKSEHYIKLNSNKLKTSASSCSTNKMPASQKAPKSVLSRSENPSMHQKDSVLHEKKNGMRESIINKRTATSEPSGEIQRKQIGGKIHPPPATKSALQSRQNPTLGTKTHSGKVLHAQNIQKVKSAEVLHERPRDVSSSHSLYMKQIPSKDKIDKKYCSQNFPMKSCPPRNVPKQALSKDPSIKQFPSKDNPVKQFPNKDSSVRQFPPRDLQMKKFPPSDIPARQFPPRDIPARQFPPRDIQMFKRPIKMPVKRRIESDDEDDEMDDFIDDGPCEQDEDYSKHIREIFGYDRRKYMFDDEDLDNMESSFTQQMKEEAYSARMGLLEDLEDMKREEMELARKKRKIR